MNEPPERGFWMTEFFPRDNQQPRLDLEVLGQIQIVKRVRDGAGVRYEVTTTDGHMFWCRPVGEDG